MVIYYTYIYKYFLGEIMLSALFGPIVNITIFKLQHNFLSIFFFASLFSLSKMDDFFCLSCSFTPLFIFLFFNKIVISQISRFLFVFS